MKKIWIAFKKREIESEYLNMTIILGVYDNEGDAIARINEEFFDCEEDYIEEYGERAHCSNHHNGYAECISEGNEDIDSTILSITWYEVNKATYDEF